MICLFTSIEAFDIIKEVFDSIIIHIKLLVYIESWKERKRLLFYFCCANIYSPQWSTLFGSSCFIKTPRLGFAPIQTESLVYLPLKESVLSLFLFPFFPHLSLFLFFIFFPLFVFSAFENIHFHNLIFQKLHSINPNRDIIHTSHCQSHERNIQSIHLLDKWIKYLCN